MSRREIPDGVVLVLGGRSEIGVETARRVAAGRTIVLAARRSGDLETQRRTLLDAGAAAVHTVEFDADALDTHAAIIAGVVERHGDIGLAVPAFGILGDQARAERDAEHAVQIVHTDYVAQIAVLTRLAELMRARGRGALVVFSSVAGWRVRRANYVYGSAKAGLDGFATGLSDALHGTGVHVLVVRPGFVVGHMTEGMDPAPWSSTPDRVADATVAALRRGARTVWVPGILRVVFFGMRLLPGPVWRRLPR
ncbi:SDR family NAD(P)-dependent oxidoreductase [Rhodococcus rhodnii]|uniref:Short chain dehydrogenase n=2 Tax=Rhodococcus rhodnii TaxID=38312 RepID=R7WSV9_9NOCA|nr:SDR family NAD(P)-dependent oxidoreductase [Rhodococcus rhodnii]EOM78356.1 short chain dehydrogenase [Rhodococcus rhodnii LMG 5362]TXG92713.1 SDR family NAD(P)-dependent oxidoreductase [Rhodococcus rhodnii]